MQVLGNRQLKNRSLSMGLKERVPKKADFMRHFARCCLESVKNLRLCRSWLSAVRSEAGGLQTVRPGSADDITASLLTLCLLALKGSPHPTEATG